METLVKNLTKAMINYRIFSISFIPAISLYFIFLKNLTHPLHSKYLSPFLKEMVSFNSYNSHLSQYGLLVALYSSILLISSMAWVKRCYSEKLKKSQ